MDLPGRSAGQTIRVLPPSTAQVLRENLLYS
jgi:hypothetical protein